jgi:hypothetical protein
MSITHSSDSPWLLLLFSLPARRASERVGIWRKLQKFGALPLRNSGYVLPNLAMNRERFEWLATAIRGFKGDASVLQVQAIDDLPPGMLEEQFRQARAKDYASLLRNIQKLKPSAPALDAQVKKLRRRFEDIVAIDFFESPLRQKIEEAFRRAERPKTAVKVPGIVLSRKDYRSRIWITRPRPGIDRVSSAWLIQRFVDPEARFIFASDAKAEPDAVPYDMYQAGGFGHEADHCTFETIVHRFDITDKRVYLIAQAVHDADLDDEKFGRAEGFTIHCILKGWAKQGVTDEELLRRGMDLIEGLYHSIS